MRELEKQLGPLEMGHPQQMEQWSMDGRSLQAVRSRLDDGLGVGVLRSLLNSMDGVVGLFTDSVNPSRRRQNNVVYYDLGQVKIGISSSHMLKQSLNPTP